MKNDKYEEACVILEILLQALGAGLAIWGAINILEGCNNNDRKMKEQGEKQIVAGSRIASIPVFRDPSLYDIYYPKDLDDVISETE